MMRLLRQYGPAALFAATLVMGIANGRAASALSLPTQNFSDLQDVGGVAAQLRKTGEEAREITGTLVQRQLAERGIEGEVDIEALVTRGDYASVFALPGLTSVEKQALVENVRTLYGQTGTLLDQAKQLSSHSAIVQQPGDGEGGGFGASAAAGLANSSRDLVQDLDQYHDQLDETKEQLEKVDDLWIGLQGVLSAKPTFLPEKPDSDSFVVFVNYVGGAQLYPSLYSALSDSFVTKLNEPYASVLDEVTTSVQRTASLQGRLSDTTKDPLSAAEVAFANATDYQELLSAGQTVVQGHAQSVAGELESRYGSGFEAVSALRGIGADGAVDMAVANDGLGAVALSLPASLDAANAKILEGLKGAAGGTASAVTGGPSGYAAARAALGPQGSALVDRHASIAATAGRTADKASVERALAGVEAQMRDVLDTQKTAYLSKMATARNVAGGFVRSTPEDLLAAAGKARDRVGVRGGANIENATSVVGRLLDRQNYQQTITAELDTWKRQAGDFQYLTNLTKILQYQAYLKPPTV